MPRKPIPHQRGEPGCRCVLCQRKRRPPSGDTILSVSLSPALKALVRHRADAWWNTKAKSRSAETKTRVLTAQSSHKQQVPLSAYIRYLILRDLHAHGIPTDHIAVAGRTGEAGRAPGA